MKYDVIIVGSGMTGLVTGAVLAINGMKVAIVEKNSIVGGLAQMINWKGQPVYAGAHHIGGVNRDGIWGELMKELNMESSDYFVEAPFVGCYLNHILYKVPTKLEELEQFILEKFPNEVNTKFFISELKMYRDSFIENDVDGMLDMFRKNIHKTYEEFLEQYFTDETLMKLLTVYGPGYAGVGVKGNAFTNLSLVISYCIGSYYMKGGNQRFIRKLVDTITEHNGVIHYNMECSQLLDKDHQLQGIVCESIKEKKQVTFEADHVILTVKPDQLIKNQINDKRMFSKLSKMKPGPTAIRLFLQLKDDVDMDQYPQDIIYFGDYTKEELENNILIRGDTKQLPTCMMCMLNKIEGFPKDKKIVMFTFIKKDVEEEEFSKEKLLDCIQQQFPEVSQNIINSYLVKSNMFQRVTNTGCGSVFGWERNEYAMMNSNSFSPTIRELKGLYIAGNWSANFGIYGCVRTAMNVSKLCLSSSISVSN